MSELTRSGSRSRAKLLNRCGQVSAALGVGLLLLGFSSCATVGATGGATESERATSVEEAPPGEAPPGEKTLDRAALEAVRTRFPGAEFTGIELRPTTARREAGARPRRERPRSVRRAELSERAATRIMRYREREAVVEETVSALSLEERVGQLFMVGFHSFVDGSPVHSLSARHREVMDAVQPGGVILFGPNIDTVEQVRTYIQELQDAAGLQLIIATDQEGGGVSRLTESGKLGATEFPDAEKLGSAGDPWLAEQAGEVTARELQALGITMNFGPVADVNTNRANPVIAERAFSSDVEVTGRMVAATVRGLQRENISAVLKHFPGHGDTALDTHYDRAVVEHDRERLETVEWPPFERGIEAGADAVMTAHVAVPALTGDDRPATIAPEIIQRVLREELGFDGVVITDSLAMGALRGYGEGEIAIRALAAGVDMILRPSAPEAAYRAVLNAVQDGRLSEDRIEQSVRRILRLKYDRGLIGPEIPQTTALPPEEVLGSPRHRDVRDLIDRALE